MEQTNEKPKKKIFRWIFLVVLVLNVVASILYPPVTPHVQLPAEDLTPKLFTFLGSDFHLTNTMVATLIADIILLLIAFSINRQIKSGKKVLSGIAGMFSAILEGLYSMTEGPAGKYARKIFPYFATIFLLVWIVNVMELIPGVDSIGIIHESEHGVPVRNVIPGILTTLVKPDAEEGDTHSEEVSSEHEGGFGLIPFVRVASTDLNFTIAIALSSVVMTQVIGIQALGVGYFTKYWNTLPLRRSIKEVRFGNPLDFIQGFIYVIVGILEVIAEIAKIISFSFRLFGNIFAGSVMLFVLGSLVPVFIQFGLLGLELFVGLIQAFVFGMLTMVFMSNATHSHAEEHG